MCNIKCGENISNNEDIKNLITSLILRQNNIYSENSIAELTHKFLNGSKYKWSGEEINKIINDSLDIFIRNGEVSCRQGKYKNADIK